MLFLTTAAAGRNLFGCVASNIWSLQTVSSLSQLSGTVSSSQLPATPTFTAVSTGDATAPGEIKLYEIATTGDDFVSWLAPDAVAQSVRYRMPATAPSALQVLQAVAAPNTNGIVATQWTTLATPPAGSGQVQFSLDGGGSAISAGTKGWVRIPYSGTITSQELTCDRSGSIVLDVWKGTYETFPLSSANTITASAKPTLSSAVKTQDVSLTGWTTGLSAGDYLQLSVTSAATVQYCVLSLQVTKN
jgi:hypothetical protein